ncbi:MAG: ABC transporter permease [Pyrinomonadaceae bacterium]|nr:ABC transporter permease [Pyrinomonadaceae bacterium]
MVYFGAPVTWKVLLVPAFLVFLVVIVASLSLLLSAVNVRFRDVKFVVPFFLQVWLFLSPVFYSSDWVPAKWQYVFALNPLTGCLNGFRHILFGTHLDSISFLISCGSALVMLLVAVTVFRKMENTFADVL